MRKAGSSWRETGYGHKPALVEGRFRAIKVLGWARLLNRFSDLDLKHCPNCGGGTLKIIADCSSPS
jgi:hypothetical protein